jgi:hypothetical protein
MKLQDPITTIINVATPSLFTSSILMVAGHQRTRRRTLDHLRRKEPQGISVKDHPNTAKEAELQIGAAVMAEAHTQSSLRTVCTMATKLTITPKTDEAITTSDITTPSIEVQGPITRS